MNSSETVVATERTLAQEAEQHEVEMRRAKKAARAWYFQAPAMPTLLRRLPD